MKNLIILFPMLAHSLIAQANQTEPSYIKEISNYIEKHPNDFITYLPKGADKEDAKYVPIKKDIKTNRPVFSVASGGSYPVGMLMASFGKPIGFLVSLYDDNPKNIYNNDTISINFTDSSDKKQTAVCVVTDYKLCGEAQISSCATTENGKGYGDRGYSASALENVFVYNHDLHQKCEARKKEINNSRVKTKVTEQDEKKTNSGNSVHGR